MLELALTHRSFSKENGGVPTNEKLEFLGDSVLGLFVTEQIYSRFPDLTESRLSVLRAEVVSTKPLAAIARELGIGQYLRIGKGEESTGGRDKNSLLADTLEALIGAIFVDHGYYECSRVITPWFGDRIDAASADSLGTDIKSALQELAAAMGLPAPEYEVEVTGPSHDRNFTAVAIVGGERFASGSGKNKRDAQQITARHAYDQLIARK